MSLCCLFCSKKDIEVLYKSAVKDINTDIDLVKCMACSSIFLNPLPSSKLLEDAYSKDYYGWTEKQKFLPIVDSWINYFSSSKARTIAKNLKENAEVLDIGCGDGKFLSQLNQYGSYSLHGQELPSVNAERLARKNYISLNTTELQEGSYLPNQFDIITLFHVFEHLINPVEILNHASKWLKEEGKLVIEIPNGNSWQMQVFGLNWFHLDLPRHVQFINREELISLANERHLQLIQEKKISTLYSPYGFQQSLLNLFHKRMNYLYEGLKGNQQIRKEFLFYLELLFVIISFPIFVLSDLFSAIFNRSAVVRYTFKKLS